MTEVFSTAVCRLIIILLLCTYPKTVGGRDVKGTSGLILQPLVSSWRIVLHLTGLFKCLLISGNTNMQACRPGGEDKEWRGNGGHSSPCVTGIVLEQAPVTPSHPLNTDHRGQTEKERKRRVREKKTGWICLLYSSFSFMLFFPSLPLFPLSLLHIQTT